MLAYPPDYKSIIPYSRKVRLTGGAAQVNAAVTVHNIARFQSMATAGNLAYSFAFAIKLKCIRIWFLSATPGTNVTAAVEWNAGSTGFLLDGVSVSAQTMSSAELTLLTARPPTQSLAGWYQSDVQGGTNQLCLLTFPNGSLVEFDFDWTLNVGEPASGSFAIAGGTAGTPFAGQLFTGALVPVAPLTSYVV